MNNKIRTVLCAGIAFLVISFLLALGAGETSNEALETWLIITSFFTGVASTILFIITSILYLD